MLIRASEPNHAQAIERLQVLKSMVYSRSLAIRDRRYSQLLKKETESKVASTGYRKNTQDKYDFVQVYYG